MTYSILARDATTGEIGGAVATGTPSAGGFVLHMAAGIGAIATQGFSTNTLYGREGLRLLEEGHDAEAVVARLIKDDDGRQHRQVAVIDRSGATAGWTGEANIEPMAHYCEDGLVVAVNWVSSLAVAEAMQAAYREAADRPLAERLLSALAAGEARGGDARGVRSAALRTVSAQRPPVDFRADHDRRPLEALRAVADAWNDPEFQSFLNRLPTADDPHRH